MSQQDYDHNIKMCQMALQQSLLFLETLPEEDLKEMLDAVAQADAVGHIFDPTRYRNAMHSGTLEYQKLLIKTCLDLKGTIVKLNEMTVKAVAAKAERAAQGWPG